MSATTGAGLAHPYPFDPAYGYTLDDLRQVPPAPEPPGFPAFWRGTFAAAQRGPLNLERRPSAARVAGFEVFDIAYDSLDGFRIRGWLMLPERVVPTRGLVISHGYGGREGPDDQPLLPDAAMIFPCARGLSLSRRADVPAESSGHVLHGIESRDRYILRGCVADLWLATSALQAWVPGIRRLDYVGTSFGGGLGALALPWDDRFQSGFLELPSFGQQPLRLTLPNAGSGEAVRQYARRHPAVAEVLAYFDASVAARHLHRRMLVVAAPFDPFVPPPGQFAVYNALPGPKELLVVSSGHFEHAGSDTDRRAVRAALHRFLQA